MDQSTSVWNEAEQRYRDRTPTSREYHLAAQRVLPGGDTRGSIFYRPYPIHVERGAGCRLWDVDGNEYVDFQGNKTSLIHGHAHPHVLQAIRDQLERGTVHASPTAAITKLASMLVSRIPSLDRVRFTNSGTEAMMHAIRAARGATGRIKIMKMEGGYHGSYDAVEVSVRLTAKGSATSAAQLESRGLSPRIADEAVVAPYNNLEATRNLIRRHAGELAAVIVEPMMGRGSIPAEPDFLHGIREETRLHDVVLIFDEIQTFRLAYGGAQSLFGVQPDLTTLGKLIGGGMPAGAFGGRSEIMDQYDPERPDAMQHAGTFNGSSVTMVAGIATLELLTEPEYRRINELGAQLRAGLQDVLDLAGITATVTGVGSFAYVHFVPRPVRDQRSAARSPKELPSLMNLALLNRGLFSCSGNRLIVSTCMTTDDVRAAVDTVRDAVAEIASALPRASAGARA